MDADLRHLLHELKAALGRLAPEDPARPDIERVTASVERRLDGPADEDEGFAEHLQEVSVRFEVDHPRLGHALRTVINALGSAGI